MSLRALGWDRFFAAGLDPWKEKGCVAARVATQHRGGYEIWTADAILPADVSGRFRHQTREPSAFPAVGDWVAAEVVPGGERGIIQAVLPRKTKLSRVTPGLATEEQVLVTNVDEVFVLEALAAPLNPGRLQRFVSVAAESGARVTVLLTKADLAADLAGALAAAKALGVAADIVAVSALQGQGLEAVRRRVRPGRTVVLLGRSGAGKSTLVNQLSGEECQFVLPVRAEDQKGRHATTGREMVFLSGGGVLIDTPGLRELQLWEGADGVETTFAEIEERARGCRFTDCRHDAEPGCAVRAALERGEIERARWEAYRKLRAEVAEFAQRRAVRAQVEQRRQSRLRRRRNAENEEPPE